ncbi:hypothetical protein MRX96_004939 [Rhipicephalus microplus]
MPPRTDSIADTLACHRVQDRCRRACVRDFMSRGNSDGRRGGDDDFGAQTRRWDGDETRGCGLRRRRREAENRGCGRLTVGLEKDLSPSLFRSVAR